VHRPPRRAARGLTRLGPRAAQDRPEVLTLVRRALNHDAQETVASAAELLAELRPPLRDAAQAFAPRPCRPARF
jgi:hypothetical protein